MKLKPFLKNPFIIITKIKMYLGNKCHKKCKTFTALLESCTEKHSRKISMHWDWKGRTARLDGQLDSIEKGLGDRSCLIILLVIKVVTSVINVMENKARLCFKLQDFYNNHYHYHHYHHYHQHHLLFLSLLLPTLIFNPLSLLLFFPSTLPFLLDYLIGFLVSSIFLCPQ